MNIYVYVLSTNVVRIRASFESTHLGPNALAFTLTKSTAEIRGTDVPTAL